MRDVELYRHVLGLESPWTVARVDLTVTEQRVDVWTEHRDGHRWACPECTELPLYDHAEERAWRHLDTCGIAFIAAFVPWLDSFWSLISDEPLFVVVRRAAANFPLPLSWLAVLFGLAGLVTLAVVIFQQSGAANLYRGKAAVAALGALRELAVHTMLNRHVDSEEDVRELKRHIDLWEDAVRDQLMLIAGQSDVTYFRVLGTYNNKGLPGWNTEHSGERNMLAERLDRLLEIMRRVEERARE